MGLTEQQAIELLLNRTSNLYAEFQERTADEVEATLRLLLTRVGVAEQYLVTEEELVDEMLLLIMAALRSGELAPGVRRLIEDFIAQEILNSPDDALARKLLGIPKRGRGHPPTSQEVRWDRASAVYLHYLEQGKGEEEALEAAWLEYYSNKDMQTEKIKAAYRKKGSRQETAYESQIRWIKSRLNQDGHRARSRPGRKPKL